jgi:hypothetical protein
VEQSQVEPKKSDDNRHSKDGGKDSICRFLPNHNFRLWKSRSPKKAIQWFSAALDLDLATASGPFFSQTSKRKPPGSFFEPPGDFTLAPKVCFDLTSTSVVYV